MENNEDIKKELEALREDMKLAQRKLKKLTCSNRSRIKQMQYLLLGGFTAMILMILNVNLKAEEMLDFLDKASDNYLKLAALVVSIGGGAAALQVKEAEDEDDEPEKRNS